MIKLINEVAIYLQEHERTISFGESCTGGALVSSLVSVPGASKILSESYVTYSIDAKKKILGVKEETINKYTVYSKEVAREMCVGLFNITGSDICISITGHAGGEENPDNGIAYVCVKYLDKYYNYKLCVEGNREEARLKFVRCVFQIIKELNEAIL